MSKRGSRMEQLQKNYIKKGRGSEVEQTTNHLYKPMIIRSLQKAGLPVIRAGRLEGHIIRSRNMNANICITVSGLTESWILESNGPYYQ